MPIPRSEGSSKVQITDHKAIAKTLLMMGFLNVKPVQPTSIVVLRDSALPGARMQANAPSVQDVTPPAEPPTETPSEQGSNDSYSTPLTPPGGSLNTPPEEGAT